MSITVITITSADTAAMILDQLDPQTNDGPYSLMRVSRYTEGMSNGNFYYSTVVEDIGAVQAHATITSTGTASNNETMSLANTTLTAKTSGAVPSSGQFNISAVVATQATSIALAINSIAALSGIVTATSLAGVVTVTAVKPGIGGNGLQMSEALTNVTVTQFSGGSNGTEVVVS